MSNIATHRWARKLPRILGTRCFLFGSHGWTRVVLLLCNRFTAEIDSTVVFAHKGLGVVIGHDAVIGSGTKILHNVTIGGRSGVRANPVIGRDVLVGAGAIIMGERDRGRRGDCRSGCSGPT